MASFVDVLLPLLNHLLEREAWARQRLQPYAGHSARIVGGPLTLTLLVLETGSFAPGPTAEAAEVTIALPPDALFQALSDPSAIFSAARLSGAANFAETLAFVFRNLRWDYEGDLATIVGDIPARRLARALTAGVAWQRSVAQRLGANLVEFATEEAGLVTPARDLAQFARAVDQVRDDVARLEKRISRLAGS